MCVVYLDTSTRRSAGMNSKNCLQHALCIRKFCAGALRRARAMEIAEIVNSGVCHGERRKMFFSDFQRVVNG